MLAGGKGPWVLSNIKGYNDARSTICGVKKTGRLDYKNKCDKQLAKLVTKTSKGLDRYQLERFGLALKHLIESTSAQCRTYVKKRSTIVGGAGAAAHKSMQQACRSAVVMGGRALKQHNRDRVKLKLKPIGFKGPGQKKAAKSFRTWSAFLTKMTRVKCPKKMFLWTDNLDFTCYKPLCSSWKYAADSFRKFLPHGARVLAPRHLPLLTVYAESEAEDGELYYKKFIVPKRILYSDKGYRSGKKVPAYEVYVMLTSGKIVRAVVDAINDRVIVWGKKKLY